MYNVLRCWRMDNSQRKCQSVILFKLYYNPILYWAS